jgi:hypothetical protein
MALTLWKVSVKAYDYWRFGTGEAMNVGPVICLRDRHGLLRLRPVHAFLSRAEHHVLHDTSSLLDVEATNTRIDALMSGGIGVAASGGVADSDGLPIRIPPVHRRFLHHPGPDGVHGH